MRMFPTTFRRTAMAAVSRAALSVGMLSVLALLPAAPLGAQANRGAELATGLPSLGDGAEMSIAAERRLGDSIARDIYRDPDYLDDPVLGDYLQAMWQPLLGAARTRGDVPPELAERLAWELMVSRDKRVNAFALPGGYLGVNLGLLAVTETPEELASVLAHELSHVSQRHIARMISRQDQQAPWILGTMILGILAARANADVANAAVAGSQAVAAQTQLNFSRDMEREADRVGFGVLTSAGFDGMGFVTMFDKLQQAARHNDDGSFPYLRSHPLSSERMADMRARLPIGGGPRVGPLNDSPLAQPPSSGVPGSVVPVAGARGVRASALVTTALHGLVSARARVLAEKSPDLWRAWLQQGQTEGAKPNELYAAALSAHRLGQRDLALALAQKLQTRSGPDTRWVLDALQMELLLAPGALNPAQAAQLKTLREAALASQQRALVLQGAQAALASGASEQAAVRLQDWVMGQPRDALAWQLLAQAQMASGHRLRAVRSEAEARVAQRDYAGAVDRFKAAQGLPATDRAQDPIELAIVDVRLRAAELLLRDSLRED